MISHADLSLLLALKQIGWACRLQFRLAETHSYLLRALELIESLGERDKTALKMERISGS